MFCALDSCGNRIYADEANKGEKYTCPICNHPVILRRGQVNIDHFAHESNDECVDDWKYDMSEWHRRMQNYFPKESQEVVVTHRGKKHRADVLIGDVVLEFQHSPFTASEFEARNRFFRSAGYRLAWVFDLSHIPDDDLYLSESKENMMIWKHPMRIFANSDYLSEDNKHFALWFSYPRKDFGYEIEEKYEYYEAQAKPETREEYMERVVWAIKDEGCYSMRRFIVSDNPIKIKNSSVIDPYAFFHYEGKQYEQKLSELKNKHWFSIKYKGKKGKPADAYICPRKNGKFGIDLRGERGCYYCKHCYMVTQTSGYNGKEYASYCCYPKQVRELDSAHPGYECQEVDIFEM